MFDVTAMVPHLEASLAGQAGSVNDRQDSARQREVEQQFEAVFYSLIVKELRSTMSEEGLFPGEGTDSYGVLFDQLMGQHLAEAQPLGIGRMLAKYHEAADRS